MTPGSPQSSDAKTADRDFAILVRTSDVAPYLGLVKNLADSHREELGFLPYSAYDDLVAKEQLWVAVHPRGNVLLGYLAFGGSNSSLRVSQLCVSEDARRHGVGAELIRRLKDHAHSCQCQVIVARVASDLHANRFWEEQGFYVIKQAAGGRTSGRTINVRVYELPKGSLLEAADASPISDWIHTPTSDPVFRAPTYSLDLNVVFDVLHERLDGDLVSRLFAMAFAGEVRLCVSSEFMVEVRRTAVSGGDPLMRIASSLPMLPQVDLGHSEGLNTELRELVFPKRDRARKSAENDTSDLNHLAISIHHGLKGFITRERAILRAASSLRKRFGLEVLSPFDIVVPSSTAAIAPMCTAIDNGEATLRNVLYDATHLRPARELLTELDLWGRTAEELLEASIASHPRTRFLVYAGQVPVAFAYWHESPVLRGGLRCFVLAREDTPTAQLVIDHCLGTLLSALPADRVSQCELWTGKSQLNTRSTARLLGFSRRLAGMDNFVGLSKHAFNGIVMPAQWARFASQFFSATGTTVSPACPSFSEATSTGLLLGKEHQATKRTLDLLSFESELAPLLVLAGARKAVIVPIRDKLASELLPSVSIQSPLFGKEAIVHIERAYFSRAASASLFERGTIVVFYVSGAEGGRGEAVGVARITSCGSGTAAQLRLELLRQGVLTLEDLGRMADASQEIGYFTFDAFSKFNRPLPFVELKKLGCVGPANLITSQALSFEKLVSLVERSGAGGL